MHNASHPEDGKEKRSVNPVLRQQLKDWRAAGNSNNKLAKKLATSASYIQFYIDDDFPGDIGAFERKLVDFFENEARRRVSGIDTAECAVTTQIKTAAELIRKTNDLGVVVATSGTGKTRGMDILEKEYPTGIFYHTHQWSKDIGSVESAMFEAIGKAGYDNRTKRAIFMVNKLRGSDRFLGVDDAHKLTLPAIRWFVDFYDATGIPMMFYGTLELLAKIESDPQLFSRVGFYEEVKSVDGNGRLIVDRKLIKHLVQSLIPTVNGELEALCDLAEQVAEQHGHYRSVHKQLKLAVEIKSGNSALSFEKAFRAAHTKLIRNYKLN